MPIIDGGRTESEARSDRSFQFLQKPFTANIFPLINKSCFLFGDLGRTLIQSRKLRGSFLYPAVIIIVTGPDVTRHRPRARRVLQPVSAPHHKSQKEFFRTRA